MSDRDLRERDILVAPGEYAYVQDLTKGDIVLYVGPTKISLSNTERMITYRKRRFVPVSSDDAGQGVHAFVSATSSQYIVVENPASEGTAPPIKGANSAATLDMGRKIVVPGPARFPLWPGQEAQVIDGHELTQDEYLIVRVYEPVDGLAAEIGSELIIRGSQTSFYMPRTGLEVVPDPAGFVRTALRLDRSQGLHLRVVADFEADGTTLIPAGHYVAGQDILVRDREGYYIPQSEVRAIGLISPIPLADNEAIYTRDHASGTITTIYGPINYLPDPTRETIVHRSVPDEMRALYRIGDDSDRALAIDVPPSTAVMVIGTQGREVVIGPATRVLGYHERLEQLTLSTGRPKSDGELLSACFLQVEGNKVSDVITVRTRDHVELEIALSYRVSFVGDSGRWFKVKDYVGLLCDHLGSIVRAAARTTDIHQFYSHSTEQIRTAILGQRTENGKRDGRLFEENGMWVYDVEVLDVRILDAAVQELLAEAQHAAIVSDIARQQEELRLGDEEVRERVNQSIFACQRMTLEAAAQLEEMRRQKRLAEATTEADVDRLHVLASARASAEALTIASDAQLASDARSARIEAERLRAHATAFAEQMAALQPELIATLKSLGSHKLVGELSRNLAPLAILGGESVADVAERLLERLPVGTGLGEQTIRSLLYPGGDRGEDATRRPNG